MQNITKEDETVLIKIQRNDLVGRYAVTSSDLEPGDVIFSETPFAFGPKTDSPPLCLGCCIPINDLTLCTSCKWPVCDENCEIIPAHRDAECSVFSKAKVRFQPVEDYTVPCLQYECITPLRVLLATLCNPGRWNQEVKEMEAHNTIRKNRPIWKFNQINIVNYLRGPCKLKDVFDEELIHTVCGILESNAFEARSISGHPIRCLYPKLAILSHNCISNITHSIVSTGAGDGNDFRVTVRAVKKVQKGEELFSSYTYSLWPTLMRRAHLKESKYFDCCCTRCSDPTEMGTHMSTLKCRQCDNGLVTSTAPLDSNADWRCSNCKNVQTSEDIKKLFATIQEEIDMADNFRGEVRTEILEKLLRKYENLLHQQNAYCCILLSSLIHMYGRLGGCTTDNCYSILFDRKIEFCKRLLKILNVIEPGYSRIRGLTLYELYTALARSAATHQAISPDKDVLQEMAETLEECATILTLEGASTLEGKIGFLARKSLFQLKQNLDELEVVDESDGCGGKFSCIIVSEKFEGKPLLARHRLVNTALQEELKNIHAFSQKTFTPQQWTEQQKN